MEVLSAVRLNSGGQQSDSGIWVHRGYSAAVFISLHLDVCNTTRTGFKVARWMGYSSDGTNGSNDAADRLVSAIWREYALVTGQRRDEATITDNMRQYYALNSGGGITASTPGAILEMAFLSERGLTGSDAGHWTMAYGVVNSIKAFLRGGTADTTPPVITSFGVNPTAITSGSRVTINYSVRDSGGSGLNRMELWRFTEGTSNWALIQQSAASGDGPINGSFGDVPPLGAHWYGVHAVDASGNWSVEPNPPGPIRVTVGGGTVDSTPPRITSFGVAPTNISPGGTITISYTTSDTGGSGLNRVELLRFTEGASNWVFLQTRTVSGNGPSTGTFADTPTVGAHWYGVHAVDNASNWSAQPNPPGPIRVVVASGPGNPDDFDAQTRRDMITRAGRDVRFGGVVQGTFGKDLAFDSNWELRWVDFYFSQNRTVRMYHATHKSNSTTRYVLFWDPDASRWIGWDPV